MQALAAQTGCPQVAAWGRRPGEAPRLLAAQLQGSTVREPDPAGFEALARLSDATPLAGCEDDALDGARAQGFDAAIAIDPGDAHLTVLLTGEAEAGAPVRPRTLAALRAAAERLRGPLQAAATAERIAALDERILHLDRLASVGALVAEIVHEIRNPLVSVKTFLQLLPENKEDPEFVGGFLEVANEEMRRVERLLEVVLEHGRPASPARDGARAAAAACVDSVTQLLSFRASDGGVTLEGVVADALPDAAMRADALRQVVLNLAVNAIEATPSGGTVRVVAQPRGDAIELRVEDDGHGIPDAVRETLFEPFRSTKERAGGLGLAITRRLVDEAGGTITVEARDAGGTCFTLTLPAAG